jgi:hypothetical protein
MGTVLLSGPGLSTDPFVWVAVIVFALALVAWFFSSEKRIKRKLRAAQKWAIGELPENTIGRVIGEVQPLDRTLTAPLTGRACVYYVAKVEQYRSNGRSGGWRTIIRETDGVPFRLVDHTGHAIVDPTKAQVALTFDDKTMSGTFDDATPIEVAFLTKHGKTSEGWLFNKKLRYTEAVVDLGETIAVLGSGVREGDPMAMPPGDYRSAPATRLRLTSSARFPLVISDDPSTTQR